MSRTVAFDNLIKFTKTVLLRCYGYSEREADVTSRVLVEADARNIPSHGVSRLDFYRKNIQGGFAKPGAEPEIVWQTPVSLVVDGHDGIGSYIAEWSVDKTIEKAKQSGTAFCAVRDSNHYGIAGLWAEKIARQDMIGMAFTNTRTCGIPTYGRERVLGTNPIAVAIPEREDRIFLLDMATSTVAHGKVEVYDRRKKPMPQGWAVDENGVGTTDATAFEKLFYANPQYGGHLYLGGEGEENGGHKGFGLALLVEILCSGLSLGMSSLNTFQPGKGSGITHFFGAMRLDLFGRSGDLKDHVGDILRDIRVGEKAAGQERIYIHGEKEAEARTKSLKEGIFIDDATAEFLDSLAKEAGIPIV
ncbi:Ldh family oxidoreductase [Treponema primitia]|uniref:Ldh family oxidoreductase n=1 Tax=Treponema primitia TaxID=88058 RepID=UPI0002555439|nr:Ldh family oxidoreductase [Treponema primitia]